MATSNKLNLTRDQLASFLQDHEQIKQFERLFSLVNELVPTTIADLIINAGNADQKAIQALDALKRIADALELLATAPTATPQHIAQDDLAPSVQPATVIDDLTPPVSIVTAQDDLTPPPERHNSIDYVDFNPLGPVPADKPGRVYWSDDDATLDVMLEGGVTGQVCQQLDFHPKNTSGVQINKGQAVMATGVIGSSTKITCAKAVANGSVLAQYMLGIAAQDIPANSFGYVVWFGSVRGFDTTGANKTVPETWVDGDILYFDPVYPGELTKVEPVAPNLDLPIAIVTSVGANGSIFVRMKTGESLDELHNVHVPTPVNNDLLVYDSTDVRWENKNVTQTFNLASLSANGVLYLNASKVAVSGTSLVFDGTNFGVGTGAPGFRLDAQSGATAATARFLSTATTSYSGTAYNGAAARITMTGGSATGSFTAIRFTHGGNFEALFGAVQNSAGAPDFVFQGYTGAAYIERARFDAVGNFGLGTTSFGTSATKVISVGSGVEPSSGPADTVQFYSVDRSAGNTIPAFYCEGSGVTNAGITSTAVTHKIAMKVNGTIYYLLATTNAT